MSDQKSGQHFENDHLAVQCAFRPGCVVDMHVKVSPLACQASYDRAKKEIRKEVSLPGFRKGKVTDALLTQHFGKEIDRHFRDILLDTTLREALSLVKRNPFSTKSFRAASIIRYSLQDGAEVHFEYEATPKVPVIEIEKISLSPVTPPPVSEDEVITFFTQMKFDHSTCEEVSRPAAEGDGVVCSATISTSPEHSIYKDEKFLLKKGMLPEWILSNIIGMQSGETKDVQQPSGEEGATVPVRLSVSKVLQCTLPEENDDFAKKVGASTIDEVLTRIRTHFEKRNQTLVDERLHRQLRNELIRLYAFDLPQSLVETETDARFLPHWKKLANAPDTKEDKDTARKPFLEEVKRQYTIYFLLQELFDTVKPSYTQREVFAELMYQTKEASATQSVIHPSLDPKEVLNRIVLNIAMRKCEDYCITQCLTQRNISTSPQ